MTALAAALLVLSIPSAFGQKKGIDPGEIYDARMQAAEALYRHGQIADALANLEAVPEKQRDWPWQLMLSLMDQSWAKTLAGSGVQSIALDSNGELLVAATENQEMLLYSTRPSLQLKNKVQLDAQPIHLALHPEGNALALTGKSGYCQIFSFPDLQPVHSFQGEFSQGVYQCVWSKNGRYFGAVSWELTGNDPPVLGFAKIFDAKTYELVRKIPFDPHPAAALRFDRETKRLYSATWREKIYCHDLESGKLVWERDCSLDGEYAAQHTLDLDPSESWLAAAGKDNKIRVMDAQTGQVKWSVPSHLGHKEWINCLSFDPSGKMLASGADDGQVMVWDAETGQMLLKFLGHTGPIRQLAWDAQGLLLYSAATDGEIRTWDVRHPKSRSFRVCKNGPWQLQFSGDNAFFATACSDQAVNIWDISTGQARPVFLPFSANCAAISPQQDLLAAAGHDKTLHLLDINTGKEIQHLQGHSGSIYGISFLEKGNLLATAGGKSVIIWDPRKGQVFKEIAMPGQNPYTLKPSIDGQQLFASSSKGRLYRIASQGWALSDSVEIPMGCRYMSLNQNLLATLSDKGVLTVFQQKGLKKLWEKQAHDKYCTALAFHPSLPYLLSGGYDRKLKVWHTETGQLLLSLHFPEELYNVEFSSDGRWLLVTQTEGIVHAWRIP